MKITQPTEFKPITIVLETAEEAEILWEAVRLSVDMPYIDFKPKARDFLIALSDWFSNSAKF